MSQAIISSPVAQAQMSFVWDTPNSIETLARVPLCPSTKQFREPTALPAQRCALRNSFAKQFAANIMVAHSEVASSNGLEFHNDRIGKPVRMGSVMLRLLKRYGISDEEIAEGIAEYASEAS